MPKNGPVRVSRSNRDSFLLPLLIILLGTAVLAAVLALIWQRWQTINDPDYLYPPLHSLSSSQAESPQPVESSQPPESAPPESSSSSQPQQVVFGQPLPENTRVRTDYFNDAVFIGDSITTGLQLYDLLPAENVVAYTGINLDVILTKKVMNGNTQTILEAATQRQPKKIYIMLGANGLAYLTSQQTVDYYSDFVDQVRLQNPDAIVYIQSILPIQEELFAKKYGGSLDNAKIDECNALLMKMAGEKKMYYVDVASAFKDETGGLPAEFTSDGLHFKSDSYTKWLDYLKTHTVSED